MKTVFKTIIVAGAVALSSLAVTAPASAQSFGVYGNNRGGLGFYYNDHNRSNYGHRPHYRYSGYRQCRPVRQVWFDRYHHRHVTYRQVCR